MKKTKQQKEKKLSLQKLQLMKISNLKVITGGDGENQGGFNINDGNDDPGIPTIFRTQSGK